MSSTPTRPWGAGGGMDEGRGRCAAPSPCPPCLGAWAHGRKARLPSAQRLGAGQPWPCAESPWDSSLFALCPHACPGTVSSDPTTVPGRAGQEPEGQLGTQDEVKASFRSPDWPGQAGEAREWRARGSGWHKQTWVCRQGSRGPAGKAAVALGRASRTQRAAAAAPAAARGPPGCRRCCLSTWAFMLCLEAKSRSQLDTGHLLFGGATSCRCFLAWM